MMRIQILILALLCYGIDATAQQAHLSREAYRDRVENYSQILKQQQLKSVASMEGRKIAFTGFLPQVDITGEGTLNLKKWMHGTVRQDNTVTILIRGYLL